MLNHCISIATKLKWVFLENNNITEKSTEALSSVISNSNGLEDLHLGYNQLKLGAIKVATAIKNNSSLKVLDLCNNNIPEEAADELSAAIRANRSLQKLWLHGNHLGSSTIMIVDALKKVSTLRELTLNNNENRSEELAPAIAYVLINNESMEKLGLSNNGLNDDGVIKIAKSLCKHTKLKSIHLRSSDITEKSAEALSSVISNSNGLEDLRLGYNELKLGATKVATAIKNNSSLKVLDLCNNNIPEEVADELAAAIRANRSLQKLFLHDNHLGSSTVMVVDALKKVSTLRELTLNNNENRSEELAPAIAYVLINNESMEILGLSNNGLNDDSVIKIAKSLCKCTKLKWIFLENNNITEKSTEALSSVISNSNELEGLNLGYNKLKLGAIKVATAIKNNSSLKVLDLCNNNIPEEAADELAAAIRANRSLQKLFLHGNHLGSSTVIVVDALKKISTLRELTLSNNENRSEELAPAIAYVLINNESMEKLGLSNNGLNDDSVIKIAKSLCKHTKLKSIHLQSSDITEKSAEALSSVISNSNGLEDLHLGYNELKLGATKVATAIKNNSSLKVLDLCNNNIPEEVADELAAAIRANRSLQKLLLHDNHLGSSTVMVVDALKKVSTLRELTLNNNENRSEELAPAIAYVLLNNESMEILGLSNNGLNDDSVIKIAKSLCKCTKLKWIFLENNNITEKSTEALSSVISNSNELEGLNLGYNKLKLGAIKVATAIKNNSSLKVLDLCNNNIPEEAADELAAAIRANRSLQKLFLHGNHLGSSTVIVVDALKKISTLRELTLNNNENRSEELAPAIAYVLINNESMEILGLSNNGLNDDGVIKIAKSLCKHTKLKWIYLQNNNITEKSTEALSSVISNSNGLEDLHLGYNELKLGATKVATAIKNNSSLKVLDLCNNNIPEEAADELSAAIRANKSLEELWLHGNHLGSSTIMIVNALKGISSLKVLNLNNNNIPEEAADELAAAIRANNSLEKLWLGGNFVGSSTVMIVNALKEVSSLKILHLNDNKNTRKELVPTVACVLAKNKWLQKLGLSNNSLNDDGVKIISKSLCQHTRLIAMDFQNNNITKKSVEALSSVISSNNELEALNLSNNQLQLGAIKLATVLKTISLLKVLDLQNNSIPEEAADELAAAIRANSSLEELWLGGNHLGSSLVMIVDALKGITTLKKLSLGNNGNRSKELAPAIASIVTRNKLMERLSLNNSGLNDDGVIKIAESLCNRSKLRWISFQQNNITKKSAGTLSSVISNSKELKNLYLGNNQLQVRAIKLATALKTISSLKILDLQNNNIPEEVADELAAAIRANSSLEELWLGGNHLGSSLVMIVDALKGITTLKKLSLGNNGNRSKELAPAIASIVTRNKLMERLSLNNSGLNDDGVIKIAESLCNRSKLRWISFQNNNITKKSAGMLSSVISNSKELKNLYLGNNQLQVGAIKLATALKTISSLKILDLQNDNILEEAADELAATIRANSSLEELWLGDNHLGSSTLMIVNALKEITTLKKLSLGNNGNRSKELAPAIASVVTRNKLLETISLNNSGLNDNGVIKIAESLCNHTKLKWIYLHNNNITKKSAETLSSIISSNTGLEELHLGSNHLQLGAVKVATALKTISSLKTLCLKSNGIPVEVVDELKAAIKANTSLDHLMLSDTYLGFSITKILEACCHNYNFKEFSIRNTDSCKAVANALSSFIECNSALELLNVSDNNLQSSGFMTIAQALKGLSSLECLSAFGINVTSTVSGELSSVIDSNPSLEELLLGDNILGNGLIQIVESCNRLTSLKLLELSHNCICPTQVVNFASIVSKCNSLEALSMGGICLSVDENLYLNVARICDQVSVMSPSELVNTRKIKIFCTNNFYIVAELLRMTAYQVLTPFNYQYLYVMYEYDCVYISYQHKNKFNENTVNGGVYLQKAAKKLSQIDSKAMISSLQIIRTLKVINLENNNIDEDAATELTGHLHCNNILEQLWLRGNELYDKGASVVLQSLHNLSTLLILDLSYNHLSSESADGIAVVVDNNCSLQQLWLDGNELLTRGVVRIASALMKLSSLRILSLCSNGITDDAAEEISNVITSNVLLVDLLLGNNQLQAKGICKIAMSLRKLFILKKLDLSNYHITPDAAEELAVTLSNCTNLKQLFLNDNMLRTEGTIKIANALKCINTLQVLTLSNNNITESAADVLVDVLRNNISLRIVLISGNDLQTTGVNLITQTAKNITTLQLLDVSDNNVREDEKENIRMLIANYNRFTIIV